MWRQVAGQQRATQGSIVLIMLTVGTEMQRKGGRAMFVATTDPVWNHYVKTLPYITDDVANSKWEESLWVQPTDD
jgi:hypothetical protein